MLHYAVKDVDSELVDWFLHSLLVFQLYLFLDIPVDFGCRLHAFDQVKFGWVAAEQRIDWVLSCNVVGQMEHFISRLWDAHSMHLDSVVTPEENFIYHLAENLNENSSQIYAFKPIVFCF